MLIRDPKTNSLRARFGFSEDVDPIINKAVPLNGPRDIFYALISQGADLCLADIDSKRSVPMFLNGSANLSKPGAWSCFPF